MIFWQQLTHLAVTVAQKNEDHHAISIKEIDGIMNISKTNDHQTRIVCVAEVCRFLG